MKLAIAAFGIFSLYKIAATNLDVYIWLFAASILVFALPAVVHEYYIRRRHFETTLQAVNTIEIETLDNKFSSYNSGEDYINPDHVFSGDIDLFGKQGIYHLINRAATPLGCDMLADWMENLLGADKAEVIINRQNAVRELASKIDLRQDIQVYGKLISPRIHRGARISRMFEAPTHLLGRKWIVLVIYLLPVLLLTASGLMAAGLHWGFPLGLLLLHFMINRRFSKQMEGIYKLSTRNADILRAYSRILKRIEEAEFSASYLIDLQKDLHTDTGSSALQIRRLSRIVTLFDLRRSEILHPIFNSFFFWDLHCVLHIERWRALNSRRISSWLKTIGEFEALSSFACLYYNRPDWIFPEISYGNTILEAKALGHPLIPREKRIANDFKISGKGRIAVITGPNMAGKSTFLKTLGVNIVLAQAGAPVCAEQCRLSPFRLLTSMKVSDSLNQEISLFYAELLRLKMILEAMNSGNTIFFLLDEMLKGTNALDRQAGALALLRQMTVKNTSGVVATHDLELTRLEKEFPEHIQNLHFDGYVEENNLRFDYKLKPGRCESFNALTLMRKIGIEV